MERLAGGMMMQKVDDSITSLQNIRIKKIVKLRQRRERDQSKKFLIEGYRELLRAVQAGVALEELFYCPELFLGENESSLIEEVTKCGGRVFSCSKDVFHKISYRDRPDGLLAVAEQLDCTLEDLSSAIASKASPLLVIAESIEKPGNLGTILRSSDAVGADGVIIVDRCTDIHNPNVVRASVGTLFSRPVIEAKGDQVLQWLIEKKVTILSATPSASKEYTEVDLTGPVAIIVGTEQYGLSSRWMDGTHTLVKIPMNGVADSLNVAMATTLFLYEVLRQRKNR